MVNYQLLLENPQKYWNAPNIGGSSVFNDLAWLLDDKFTNIKLWDMNTQAFISSNPTEDGQFRNGGMLLY